jgi:predicted dehydrogenase
MDRQKTNEQIDRRGFLHSAAAVGAGLAFSPMVFAKVAEAKPDDINIALLGAGAQGQVLRDACLKMPGIRFQAVCDIWTTWNLKRVSGYLQRLGHPAHPYVDYKQMLDTEKDLDAVIVATPDFWHARHAVDSMKAGLDVYCEKEMSNTLEGARMMVQAAGETGRLLQIGHQRRSNPRYIYCYERLIRQAKLLGRITTINGQWNRSKAACEDLTCPKKYEMDKAALAKYGFESMQQFRNWRWYKGKGGGPIVDLGSHQIDVYSWFLGANPKSVMASGGVDYWKGHDWYDTVQALYEYDTDEGPVRAFYQTITTNSGNGYFETFMGDEGTLLISEAAGRGNIYREAWVEPEKWDKWVTKRYLSGPIEPEKKKAAGGAVLDGRQSITPPKYDLNVTMDKPYHQPHLENFFDAIRSRGKVKLTCPAETGYETAVAVLKVNEAIEAGRKLTFTPEDFKV